MPHSMLLCLPRTEWNCRSSDCARERRGKLYTSGGFVGRSLIGDLPDEHFNGSFQQMDVISDLGECLVYSAHLFRCIVGSSADVVHSEIGSAPCRESVCRYV